MPRFFNKKRKYKSRRPRKKKSSTLAKTNRSKINKLISADKTFLDSQYSESITNTGSFINVGLTSIATGTGEGEKQGDKIVVKSLQMRLRFSVLNSSLVDSDAFNNIRVILVQFPQPNLTGSPVTATDVLEVSNWNSFYKKRGNIQYKILMDKKIYLDNQQLGGTPRWNSNTIHQRYCDVNFRFPKGITVTYVPTQSTVIKNDLKLFVISDSAIPGHPTMDGYMRLNFLS
ncbi:MAG: coat protein [Cressdnaviricota sp.]|nr:MAG: coat protein [Cressdnaviricota sp.]